MNKSGAGGRGGTSACYGGNYTYSAGSAGSTGESGKIILIW